MLDGWIGPTKLSMINFMAYSKENIVFLKLVDTLNNIKYIFKGGSIKETIRCLISKFFIYESIVSHKASSHHFKNMIIGVQQAGNY